MDWERRECSEAGCGLSQPHLALEANCGMQLCHLCLHTPDTFTSLSQHRNQMAHWHMVLAGACKFSQPGSLSADRRNYCPVSFLSLLQGSGLWNKDSPVCLRTLLSPQRLNQVIQGQMHLTCGHCCSTDLCIPPKELSPCGHRLVLSGLKQEARVQIN